MAIRSYLTSPLSDAIKGTAPSEMAAIREAMQAGLMLTAAWPGHA